MNLTEQHIEACREQFPALSRQQDGRPVVYFDGPAGTQVPKRVIDAISSYLENNNANHEGLFATSRDSDDILNVAHECVAEFLGADDPATVSFGQNMTSLTFALSRALAKTWKSGDEIIVTRLDHDANVTPWVLAAQDAGATVKYVNIHKEDCTLDLEDFRQKLSERTRLVAIGCASNASGSINPVRNICTWSHAAGAYVFLDAVHYAPHALIDVEQFGCDFLACSAYKFFGPHIGILWGKRHLLEQLSAYKLRPAPDTLPGKWMTGTQSHESIAGVLVAVNYLADLGRTVAQNESLDFRTALEQVYLAIGNYEQSLVTQLLEGLATMKKIKVWGITDPNRFHLRMPTVSLTHADKTSAELASYLGQQGIFTWHGNYYALQLTETLGLEPEGMLRIGFVHYNTPAEVGRLLAALEAIS